MKRSHRLILAAAVLIGFVLAVSLYLHSWGGLALIAVSAAGFAWYRTQVARSEAEQFFGDAGEDTRLTSFQGGSPSEMQPLEPDPSPVSRPPQPPHG
jgi:hypothetical protein